MKFLIVCDRPGRLGNLLIVYSHLAAFAFEHNLTLANPAFLPYQSYFLGSRHQHVPWISRRLYIPEQQDNQTESSACNWFIKNSYIGQFAYGLSSLAFRFLRRSGIQPLSLANCVALNWGDSMDLDDDSAIMHFKSKFNFVGGWLYRCNHLLFKHKSKLNSYFQPLDKYLRQAQKTVSEARAGRVDSIVVGVHIRQGDYRTFEGGRYLYHPSIFARYMQEIRRRSKLSISYIVVSDEVVHPNVLNTDNTLFSRGNQIVDMLILSMCDAVIGPPSTFSYFASTFWGNSNFYHIEDPRHDLPESFIDRICCICK